MPLLLADGQLAASSTTILGAGVGERTIAMTLFNTNAAEQTLSLTLTSSGGTARQFCRAKLKQNESLYLTGLPIDPATVLAGYSTDAKAVDYLVMHGPSPSFSVIARGADGAPKQTPAIDVTISEKGALTYDGVAITGLLEEVRNILLKIA